ncbi:hypothetical protein M885DRAFT_521939 [Pelagophyceae sp. CCMP2097]|nr:hypothetical protein M885DRAFT_521939 [Pelagophyceae sp. CCMP2097]
MAAPWTTEEQTSLDGALESTRGVLDQKTKWKMISELVGRPGRECVERFKAIRDALQAGVGAPAVAPPRAEAPPLPKAAVDSAALRVPRREKAPPQRPPPQRAPTPGSYAASCAVPDDDAAFWDEAPPPAAVSVGRAFATPIPVKAPLQAWGKPPVVPPAKSAPKTNGGGGGGGRKKKPNSLKGLGMTFK